mgnify:CR=1|jgi:hypothetical protein
MIRLKDQFIEKNEKERAIKFRNLKYDSISFSGLFQSG